MMDCLTNDDILHVFYMIFLSGVYIMSEVEKVERNRYNISATLQNLAQDPKYEHVLTQLRQRNHALRTKYEAAGDGWRP